MLNRVEEVSGSVAATCRYYGISRTCYYGWLRRYHDEGFEGLEYRSSVPHRSPKATGADVVQKGLWLRQRHSGREYRDDPTKWSKNSAVCSLLGDLHDLRDVKSVAYRGRLKLAGNASVCIPVEGALRTQECDCARCWRLKHHQLTGSCSTSSRRPRPIALDHDEREPKFPHSGCPLR